ncbi:glutamyl-tRNA reductase [Salinibacterium sp. NSLL150]|uniref:glutamyl-tRNA reductase n=1 Tax=unclassified Salinibacterium TaxID=2632331 RepID=UPI0018CEDEE2|nr:MULTISPECIES: glutamyl-tRNA reductase [unclassified Salinibacterium]MBH0097687.1 glutamyl-tRNA reductase [Salinibacterium sp. NSLL35]MBH0100442.1 glutamyl-tRNA reductase [Salinibacterium sp. NSLL150]MBH0103201.1 glutamyl-tRNA reductase [Salinibacterium sp. NSLL16]MBH0105962.1 glutamyl-tRNA reductase [Salinibacterium sp. NSLL17]MBH0110264.1 glutamyl-tRNA reductase [Salinibacterium sp. NG22]
MLLCLSSNHRNASLDVLESLSEVAPAATVDLVSHNDFVAGAVLVATCNRFEAYLDVEEPLTAATAITVCSLLESLSERTGLSIDTLHSSIAVHEGADAAAHLFAVTSGLESVVIGEAEISGQVSRALDQARKDGTTTRDLERLFQRATHTSRGIKNNTAIGGAGKSLVRLALELASSRVADWSTASVLVVGTGRYAVTTVNALRDKGALDLRVFSPSGRDAAFALKHGLTPSEDFDVDVIVTCTASAVLGTERFSAASKCLVLDLGLPRNVDPAVGQLDGVDLLDLETISLHAPLEELNAHADARDLVRTAAHEFAAESQAEPAIVALRKHHFALLEAEIARATARGAGDETISALRHLGGVLLHGPSVRAREFAAEGRVAEFDAALSALYNIPVERTARASDAQARPHTA